MFKFFNGYVIHFFFEKIYDSESQINIWSNVNFQGEIQELWKS